MKLDLDRVIGFYHIGGDMSPDTRPAVVLIFDLGVEIMIRSEISQFTKIFERTRPSYNE